MLLLSSITQTRDIFLSFRNPLTTRMHLQVHALNALNVVLHHSNPSDLASMKFLQDKHLLTHTLATLTSTDRAFARARPKALLTAALLLRLGPDWLVAAVAGHVLSHLVPPASPPTPSTGSAGDQELEEYSVSCRTALAAAISGAAPALLESVCPDFFLASSSNIAQFVSNPRGAFVSNNPSTQILLDFLQGMGALNFVQLRRLRINNFGNILLLALNWSSR